MARLIVWNLMTLDGFFEGEKEWDLDWHPWGDELEALSLEQLNSSGGLLFGRKTYTGMAAYWATATGEIAGLMNSLPKAVVSKTLSAADWPNSVVLKDTRAVAEWKQQADKDLYIFGSAVLVDGLLDAGLIDEFRVGLVPLVLGRGTPHFKKGPRREMTLLETRPLGQGMLLLRYAPSPADRV